jgi:cytochrome b6-f complex iron-sulfur subunit
MQTSQEEQLNLSRGEFIRSLGMSSAALMAFYCMGTTMTSCKSSDPAPVTPPVVTPPVTNTGITGNSTTATGAIDFTLDLTNANFSTLKTVGNAVKAGDVFIVNAKGGTFVALQKLCTHQQNDALEYRLATDDIKCSVHGSEFKTDGSVNKGPAAASLKKYTTVLSTDGNKLQVKA